MSAKDTPTQNEFDFQAETQRVLSLVINSLYTHSEVFLRELISNASDALDKARITALSDKNAREQEGEPAIELELDKDSKTLTLRDNGVGMTRTEVIDNLGTIARSGTTEFLEKLAQLNAEKSDDQAMDLIGQFGVGFYAVFMVAARVDVHTLSMNEGAEPVTWRSTGEGKFTVLPGDRLVPGTEIIVHLKETAVEYAEKWRVEAVIKKYSDFVMFPIRVDGEVVNKSAALWRMPRSQVTEEQHKEFFKHLSQGRAGDEPLCTVHYSVDAPVQFSALLYVPEKRASDLFQMQGEAKHGPRLYAKRVMIMEACDKLLPPYLRFIVGVVDSEDLTLNVSRETLQENRTLQQIEQQLTKQVLKKLGQHAEDDSKAYEQLWRQFGQILKEGLSIDFKNKDTIAELCRFETLQSDGELRSLDSYLEAKKDGQEAIYYITGVNPDQLRTSAHLEVFRDRDIDVLLLCDPIDEWVAQALPTYKDVPLKSITHGDLDELAGDDEAKDGDESDDKASDDNRDQLQTAAKAIASALGDKVDDVRLSSRLTETASCLVSKKGVPGANFERIMKVLDERALHQKRILEVNPKHALVQNLARLVARDPDSTHIELYSEMLYDQALLGEGVVEDPTKLVKRIQDLLVESSARLVED